MPDTDDMVRAAKELRGILHGHGCVKGTSRMDGHIRAVRAPPKVPIREAVAAAVYRRGRFRRGKSTIPSWKGLSRPSSLTCPPTRASKQ